MSDTLIPALVGGMLAVSHDTTDRLIANLNAMVADADAHRKAVEHGVQALFDGDGFSDSDLWSAVFAPPQALIDHYRQEAAR